MKNRIKIVLFIVLAGIILMQSIQPEKNLSEEIQVDDMFIFLPVNKEVEGLLKNACYDCHSNHTRYPWYNRISPVSWYLNRHVQEGKKEMNFNEFGHLDKIKRVSVLNSICEVLEEGTMPLGSYTTIHKNAIIDSIEREKICQWTESSSLVILKQ